MISQTAEYALRAVVTLAGALAGHGPLTTQQLSDAVRVPVGYLSKVMQALSRAGIVTGQRGLNGGFVLSTTADQLTLMDVVQVVDPSHRIRACPLGIEAHANGNLCPLHRRLDAAAATAEQVLRSTRVSELVSNATAVPPLCEPDDGGDIREVTADTDTGADACACLQRRGRGDRRRLPTSTAKETIHD